jgi:glycosyltransferase involved in cell wall biosynthesis
MLKSNNFESQSLVSVIINCYNGEKYLREAIDSVYAQTYKEWEIIFWDNLSTDRSAEIAKSYDSKLRYFIGEETIPLGAARNKALEQSSGEYIAFLDADDIWMPEKLKKQIPLFYDSEIGLVFSDTIFFNKKGEIKRYYAQRKYSIGHCFSKLLTDYFLSMETVIIRKTTLSEQEVWFDTRFNMIEEADLFRRIAYYWKISMVNEPLAKWRVHAESLTWTKGHTAYEETINMLKNYDKIIPNFKNNYSNEISIVKKQASINNALFLWKVGDSNQSRKRLLPYLLINFKAFALFFISFFPANILMPVLNKFRKKILLS